MARRRLVRAGSRPGPVGDAFLTPEPGVYRPRHLDLSRGQPLRAPHGLEVIALVSGINGSYRGATRLGSMPDANTPIDPIDHLPARPRRELLAHEARSLRHLYAAYVTPGSGTTANQAVVAGNLVAQANGSLGPGIVMHELSARVAVTF